MDNLLTTTNGLDARPVAQSTNIREPLKVIVIGLGGQTKKDHIPAILRADNVKIVAIVDKSEDILKEYAASLGVQAFQDVATALDTVSPDVALVSVPHNEYFAIMELLAANKIATLKEKPLAMTYAEASELVQLYEASDTYLQVCVQRRFSKLYETTKAFTESIGDVYSVSAEYALDLNAEDMASGWRADKRLSGGGAALDMGYHSIDLLTYLFGKPDKVYAQLSYNSIGSGYSIEDTMKAMLTYSGGKINVNLHVTKVAQARSETVKIAGSLGYILVDGRTVSLYDQNGTIIESHAYHSKQEEVDSQLSYFLAKSLQDFQFDIEDQNFIDQLNNMHIIDAIYASHDTNTIIELR